MTPKRTKWRQLYYEMRSRRLPPQQRRTQAIRYYTVEPEVPDDPEFHQLQVALALLAEDEGRAQVDALIRAACMDAADQGDVGQMMDLRPCLVGRDKTEMTYEVLAAIGWLLDDLSG